MEAISVGNGETWVLHSQDFHKKREEVGVGCKTLMSSLLTLFTPMGGTTSWPSRASHATPILTSAIWPQSPEFPSSAFRSS